MAASILVRAPNWIGDQILAYPFFHYLRRAFPRARIAVACVPWVEPLQFRNLVNEVLPILPPPGREKGRLAAFHALNVSAARLRQAGPWDLAIALPNSFSAAWLLFRAGARTRRGYSADGRGFLLTQRVAWDAKPFLHRSMAYAKLLPEGAAPPDLSEQVKHFWGVPSKDDLDPGVPGILPRFEPAMAWPEARPLEPPEGAYWVVAPGAVAASRRWPIEYFADLAREVGKRTGLPGLIVGGASEVGLAERLIESVGAGAKLHDWTGRCRVPDLWKVFQGARFTVANDSGLAHVASLCGSPTQIAWGAGDPKRTEPLGPGKVRIALNPVDCWPCESNTCLLPPARAHECLRGLRPEAAFGEAFWKEIAQGGVDERPRQL